MDVRPTHDRLLSLAVSAMITSAFLATAPSSVVTAAAGPQPGAVLGAIQALKADGWHGIQNVHIPSPAIPQSVVPAASPAAAAKPLSDDQLKKLLIDIANNGDQAKIREDVAVSLKLISPGQTLTVHGDAFSNDKSKDKHCFAPLPARPGFLVWRKAEDAMHLDFFYVDKDLKLIAAVELFQGVVPIPKAEAETKLAAEFEFWREEIDGGFQ